MKLGEHAPAAVEQLSKERESRERFASELVAECGLEPGQAETVLAAIRDNPSRYGVVAERWKPGPKAKPTPYTGDMVDGVYLNLRRLLRSFESVARLLPEDEARRAFDSVGHADAALRSLPVGSLKSS